MRLFSGVCLAVFFAIIKGAGLLQRAAPEPPAPVQPRSVEATDRVTIQWSGDVKPPMLQKFQEAFKQLGDKPRHVLISLNSNGGNVAHGRLVVDAIIAASRVHHIDTVVESGKICASMCVPLYLTGMERFAAKDARFMFHQVILVPTPDQDRQLKDIERKMPGSVERAKREIIAHFTDRLYVDDFKGRLDNHWLEALREKIKHGDVWLTGRQLLDQHSGVVDKLL